MPLVVDSGISVAADLSLAGFPLIESLVHHQEAHTVAEIEKLGCWGIVARADRVATHLPQNLEPALPDALRHRGPHRAGVMVQAAATPPDGLAVQQESAVGVEKRFANAEGRLVFRSEERR